MPASPSRNKLSTRILPPTAALRDWRRRGVVIKDKAAAKMIEGYYQLAFTAAGIHSVDTLTALRDSLTRAFERGDTFADWKKSALTALRAGAVKLPDHHLALIYRNAAASAAAAGRWAEIQRNAGVFKYLMYVAVMDSRTRDAHRRLDGIIRRVTDPIWRAIYPPNGHNCRCSVIQMSAADMKDAGLKITNSRALAKRHAAAQVTDEWAQAPNTNFRAVALESRAKSFLNLQSAEAQYTAYIRLSEMPKFQSAADLDLMNWLKLQTDQPRPKSAPRRATKQPTSSRVLQIANPTRRATLHAGLLQITDASVRRAAAKIARAGGDPWRELIAAFTAIKRDKSVAETTARAVEYPTPSGALIVRRAVGGGLIIEWRADKKTK